jgi:hypothetical protein
MKFDSYSRIMNFIRECRATKDEKFDLHDLSTVGYLV